jgi:capsular exopolysaccharide synthesis family protein
LRNAELKQDNYRTMYQLLQENNASTLSPSYFNIGDPTVNYYINNITQKQQQKITELKDVNEDHPKLKALNAEINSYTNGLKGYVKNNIQAADKAVNRSKIDLLQAQRKIATIPKDDRQLRDLELDYNLKKQAYSDLELRKREAEIRRETNRSDHTIIDEAKMDGDKHIAPNAMIIYFMALFFGGIIPLTYIIFMEFLNTTVKGKEDISSVTQVPLLVMLAKGGKKNRNQIIMTTQPKSLLAESFRLLKIKLDHLYEHLPTKIIGITSTVSAEGKTFCACNLSAACAMTGNRTLLICADLYQSDFNYFPIGNVGLSTYLKQQANLTAAIQNTPIEGLDILPTGGVVGNPAELLSSAQMSYLIDEIRTRYEYIIIDTPPIGYVSDYLVLEKYFNASLYMVRYGYTKTKLLRTVQELHQNEKIKNLHIVLNDVKYSSIYELRYKESRKVPAYYRHS